MPNKIDLTGQRFGRLVVLRETDKRGPTGSIVWKCKCDCGVIRDINSAAFKSGATQSCGCLQIESAIQKGKNRAKDISGQRFGRLVVLAPTDKRSGKCIVWGCICDCGNETAVSSGNLVSGKTKSCGCMQKEIQDTIQERAGNRLAIIGNRYGLLTVLSETEKRMGGSVIYKCACDCGNICFVRSSFLVCGDTKSCGCIRDSFKNGTNPRSSGFLGTDIEKIKKNKVTVNNTSGVRGVYWVKSRYVWASRLTFQKHPYTAYFKTFEDAVRCRKEMEYRIFGEFIEWWEETYGKQHKKGDE